MRAIIKYFSFLLLLAGCKKDGTSVQLRTAGSGSLKASTTNIVLAPSNDNDTVVTFSWPATDFGAKVAITYSLQLDQPSDTSGSSAWGKAKSFVVATNSFVYPFSGKDLNNLAATMGLTPGSANPIAVRIISNVNQYNGSTSTITPAYSNTQLLNITPYGLSLYVPGAYQNWDPSSAPTLTPLDGKAGLYEGYVNITGSGLQYFKYTNAPDWNHINYGDGGNGTFSTDGNAAGLSVPNGAYYELTADLNKNTWTATPTVWGIIGDATPGGWNNDTQMTYDATSQVWKVTAHMIANGSFKFRANSAWNIDFGIDNSGKLVYADNPFFGYTSGLNNLSVSADGDYTIILDLHVAGKYTYQLNKN